MKKFLKEYLMELVILAPVILIGVVLVMLTVISIWDSMIGVRPVRTIWDLAEEHERLKQAEVTEAVIAGYRAYWRHSSGKSTRKNSRTIYHR